MPGPFSPSDTLVGPIVHQIALTIQAQIPSIGYVYEKMPDRSPMDNSVIIPLTKAKVVDDTNGKLKLRLMFGLRHLFRRKQMSDNVTTAYTYIIPWSQMLAAWPNQTLGGLAISVSPSEIGVTQISESGQPMAALVVNFDVLTEINVPLT